MSQFYNEKLSSEDKITKAKIMLQNKSPFYSYLVMHLKFKRNDKLTPTIGVDPNGNVFWNDKFIQELTEGQMTGTLAHEASHVVLQHCARAKTREKQAWNISVDAVTNRMLLENNFELHPKGVIPRHDCIEIKGQEIEDISKKTAEEIYDELLHNEDKGDSKGKDEESDEKDDNESEGDNHFDDHIPEEQEENKDIDEIKNSENNSEEISKNEDIEEKWNKILSEAATRAKMCGEKTAEGLDRYIDKLLRPAKSWYSILASEIQREIPVDSDWSVPSRRSETLGTYLPSQKKENIDLAIAIDSSGSIDDKELNTFVSKTLEIIGSLRNVKLTVLVCDNAIRSAQQFNSANYNDIRKIKVTGEGGTSFQPVFDWLVKNKPNIRLLIYLTDGHAGTPDTHKYRGRTVWALSERESTDRYVKGTGKVIKLGV